GFTNIFKVEFEIVNLDQLDALDAGTTVTADALAKRGVIRKADKPLKILGRGSLTKALTVQANAFSHAAEEAIQKAGGKAELMPHTAIRPPQEKPAPAVEAARRTRARSRAAAEAEEPTSEPSETSAPEPAAPEPASNEAEENPA